MSGSAFTEVRRSLAEVVRGRAVTKRAKCQFMVPSVQYIGVTIDAEGTHPNKEKVRAIQEAPATTSVKELKAFLGFYMPAASEGTAISSNVCTGMTRKAMESIACRLCQAVYGSILFVIVDDRSKWMDIHYTGNSCTSAITIEKCVTLSHSWLVGYVSV